MEHNENLDMDKTAVKEVKKGCSRRRCVAWLVCVQLFLLMLFYFSCQVNYFDCQRMARTLTPITGFWTDETEKRKRGYDNSRINNKSSTTTTNIIIEAITNTITYTSTSSSKSINTKANASVNKKTLKDFDLTQNATTFIRDDPTIYESKNYSNAKRRTQNQPTRNFDKSSDSVPGVNSTTSKRRLSKEKKSETNEMYRFRDISCQALHPSVLLYNRIFKTASSSVTDYMRGESTLLNYTLDVGTTEDWYNTGDSFPYPDIIPRHVELTDTRLAFVAHFFFRRHLNITRPYTYVNIVREPVRRVISHYSYMRTTMRPRMRIEELKRAGQWNETIVECVKSEHRGCESNVMVRFFCGPLTYCRTGSNKALKKAKHNIRRYYAAVGLQEELNLFLGILKIILPDFFRSHETLKHEKQNNRPNLTDVTPRVIDMIRKRNIADIELYNFIKKRFRTLVRRCKDLLSEKM